MWQTCSGFWSWDKGRAGCCRSIYSFEAEASSGKLKIVFFFFKIIIVWLQLCHFSLEKQKAGYGKCHFTCFKMLFQFIILNKYDSRLTYFFSILEHFVNCISHPNSLNLWNFFISLFSHPLSSDGKVCTGNEFIFVSLFLHFIFPVHWARCWQGHRLCHRKSHAIVLYNLRFCPHPSAVFRATAYLPVANDTCWK